MPAHQAMNAADNSHGSPIRDAASRARGRFDARVVFNRPLCREHFLLRIAVDLDGPAFPATLPGQFIQFGCRTPHDAMNAQTLEGRELEWTPQRPPQPGQAELCAPMALLRRPFSIAGRGNDPGNGQTWIEVVHRVVGVGTDWLSRLRPGERVDFIGPLGNQFNIAQDRSLALLVGGGVGLPPMFYLAQALRQHGWDAVAFVGALTRDLLAVTFTPGIEPDPTGVPKQCVDEFAAHLYSTVITTDDGSLGLHGRVTDGLRGVMTMLEPAKLAQTVVFTCGPEPMMRAVAGLAAQWDVDCQVCLEQAMACGMGTCQSCIVKIDPTLFHPDRHEPPQGTAPGVQGAPGRPWRFKLACTDGPVFDSRVVVW